MKKERFKMFCQVCGKEYEVIKSRLKKTKTCSFKCKQIYCAKQQERKRVIVFCHYCAKNKEVHYFKSKSKILYCDIKCKAAHQSITNKGELNGNAGNFKYTKEQYKKFINYTNAVRSHSYSIYKLYKEKINPNGFATGRNKYHIDHRYSIHDGFHNNVPVSIMSNANNLELLHCTENLKKGTKSSIILEDLIKNKM
jgi:hypothetical protein